MQAYHEATETAALSVRMPQRECLSIDYARRSTGERSLDTGSIPVYSIAKTSAIILKSIADVFYFQDMFIEFVSSDIVILLFS